MEDKENQEKNDRSEDSKASKESNDAEKLKEKEKSDELQNIEKSGISNDIEEPSNPETDITTPDADNPEVYEIDENDRDLPNNTIREVDLEVIREGNKTFNGESEGHLKEEAEDAEEAEDVEEAEEPEEFEYEYPEDAFQIKQMEGTEPYDEVRSDFPIFHQQNNTCGLSSMLMLLDPLKNEKIAGFLNAIWKQVNNLLLNIQIDRQEFKWNYALEYLLLKSFHENILSQYIMDHKQFADDYYIAKVPLEVHLRQLMEPHYAANRKLIVDEYERFFESGTVTHFLLVEQINQMKDSKELEMIYSLFGYDFVPQWSPDGTGAIFFNKRELKHPEEKIVKQRLELLLHEIQHGSRIMCGMFHHWVAVADIKKKSRGYQLVINDPNTARRYKIPFKRLSDSDRFYIFRKRSEDVQPFWKKVLDWIDVEIQQDIAAFKEFKEEMQKRMRERLKLRAQQQKVVTDEKKDVPALESKDLVEIPQESISINKQVKNILDSPQIPLSGSDFMKRIRTIIHANFSDYSKM
ncbi:MAG: hypothetical protein GF364_19800 [Candidatus Lokiarchaeota archaeon]|nr:hypothetical protein [Candidatus Lokiarchaeota archaeon]